MDTETNTNTAPSQCYWCQTEHDERRGLRLRLCARCRGIRYCGTDCQRKDWKHHKAECAAMTEGMSKSARLAPRAILHHTSIQAQTQNPSSTAPPPNEEMVYFLKRAVPHIRDVSISGPYWPLDTLRKEVEKCLVDVGSDPGYNEWLDHVEEHPSPAPSTLPVRIVAALPKCEGFIELDIIRLHNPEVAAHLRSHDLGPSSHEMKPVFAVYEQLADADFLTEQDPEEDRNLPLLDARVDSVFLGRTEANQRVVKLLQLRKEENPQAVTDVDELGDGTAVGVVEQPKGTVRIRVLVVESGGSGNS